MNEKIDDGYSDFMITNQDEVDKFIKPANEYFSYTVSVIDQFFESETDLSCKS
ncbi:MAG: hypothetical protein JWQ40_4886 [Segetibacter sp.]|jgi:hypothetical protein|nr:hypothetical protein [Segetibacter sp.]